MSAKELLCFLTFVVAGILAGLVVGRLVLYPQGFDNFDHAISFAYSPPGLLSSLLGAGFGVVVGFLAVLVTRR